MGIVNWLKNRLGLKSDLEIASDKKTETETKAREQFTREEPLFNPFGRFAEAVKIGRAHV